MFARNWLHEFSSLQLRDAFYFFSLAENNYQVMMAAACRADVANEPSGPVSLAWESLS